MKTKRFMLSDSTALRQKRAELAELRNKMEGVQSELNVLREKEAAASLAIDQISAAEILGTTPGGSLKRAESALADVQNTLRRYRAAAEVLSHQISEAERAVVDLQNISRLTLQDSVRAAYREAVAKTLQLMSAAAAANWEIFEIYEEATDLFPESAEIGGKEVFRKAGLNPAWFRDFISDFPNECRYDAWRRDVGEWTDIELLSPDDLMRQRIESNREWHRKRAEELEAREKARERAQENAARLEREERERKVQDFRERGMAALLEGELVDPEKPRLLGRMPFGVR